jgi:glucose-6-phosphate 1-epimerase
MHITPFDNRAKQALEELIKPYPFLSLTNSKQHYPNSKGSGLPLLLVNTSMCSAVISLQGAHLLEFKPVDADPLLWLSPNCDFTPGVALRGGVPLCMPWFGVHPTDPQKPKHGFARNQFWQLGETHLMSDGQVELEFLFVSEVNELFPYDFSVELRMMLGHQVTMELTVNNTDSEAFLFSWAMHNYYKINQLDQTRVLGLTNRKYLDNLEGLIEKIQTTDVNFPGAVDRVYPDIANHLVIDGGNPDSHNIEIIHENCPSVVVWNPGSEAAAKIADIGPGQEAFYICVERGAVRNEAWYLEAGSSAAAKVNFRIA